VNSTAPLQKLRTWVDQVIDDEGTLQVDVAVAMVFAGRANMFGVVKRQNVRRLAGELGDALPEIVNSIARLVDRGHLHRVPGAAGGGYRLLIDEANKALNAKPQPKIIPYAPHAGCEQWARAQAAQMLSLPSEAAKDHLQRLLRQEGRHLRHRGATDAEIARKLISVKLSLWDAYWAAVFKLGDWT
jgi:hypothetical protein